MEREFLVEDTLYLIGYPLTTQDIQHGDRAAYDIVSSSGRHGVELYEAFPCDA